MSEEESKPTKSAAAPATNAAPRKSAKAEEDDAAKPAVVEEEGGWKQFVWNTETKEFFGRTGKSWLLITIFYIIFFLSLYCFFMLQWYVAMMFIGGDPKVPLKQRHKAILWRKGPGLSYRPIPDREANGISSLIWFGTATYSDYRHWTNQLNDWMVNIPKEGADCTLGDPRRKIKDKPQKVCKIDPTVYGECYSIDKAYDYGYSRGEPCILIKLNRIYAWEPKPFKLDDFVNTTAKEAYAKVKATLKTMDEDGKEHDEIDNIEVDIPASLGNYLANVQPELKNKILIWCDGEHPHDRENLGAVKYIPGPYIETQYFPFYNQEKYQSPFLMLKLKRPLPGALISIVCRAYARNLLTSKDTGTGYLRFQLLIGT